MELLVRIIDSSDDESASKRGDVICDQPDGHPWTPLERTRDHWRIIRVDVLPTMVEALRTGFSTPFSKRMRDWTIDFSKMPDPSLFTGPRTIDIIELTRADMVRAVTRKP